MFQIINYLFIILLLFTNCKQAQGSLNDYIKDIGKYFGYSQVEENVVDFTQSVPYEVSSLDEKFISEAAKLTGVALSDLDSCQQRVILKLKSDCHKLNDEQLAKLAVHLLNCQSYIEGRQMYPCTEDMSIKDCTTKMDSDTWTIYHLMSNRARAVCYMIRQTQFRGLAENTVNRLMDAAQLQIHTLDKIAVNQENIQNVAHETFDKLSKGHDILSQQQKDIQSAQFHGQLAIEENIARLVDEKRIIAETHNKLLRLTKDLQEKLVDSSTQIELQTGETRLNHKELIDDLVNIQEQTREIFRRIEESTEEFKRQYEYTLKNLREMNETVHGLVSLVGGTKKALEDRLEWISTALGGTDLAIERLYLMLWHAAFLLFGMLGSAFLNARTNTRLIVTITPSLNLAVGLYGQYEYLNPVYLITTMSTLILVQSIIMWILNYTKTEAKNLPMLKEQSTPKQEVLHQNENDVNDLSNTLEPSVTTSDRYFSTYKADFEDKYSREYSEFGSPTPPLSRSGFYNSRSRSNTPNLLGGKGTCHARTRVGTPCKISCLPGRDYCYRHQSGDSVSIK